MVKPVSSETESWPQFSFQFSGVRLKTSKEAAGTWRWMSIPASRRKRRVARILDEDDDGQSRFKVARPGQQLAKVAETLLKTATYDLVCGLSALVASFSISLAAATPAQQIPSRL